MDKYTCKCIVPGCEKMLEAEGENKRKAVTKLLKVDDEHNFDHHPELPIMTVEQKRSLIFGNLKLVSLGLSLLHHHLSV